MPHRSGLLAPPPNGQTPGSVRTVPALRRHPAVRGRDVLRGGAGTNYCHVEFLDDHTSCTVDAVPPTIVEAQPTPSTVAVGTAAATTRIRVHVWVAPYTEPTLISGTMHDGVWRVTLQIAPTTTATSVTLGGVFAWDHDGGTGYSSPATYPSNSDWPLTTYLTTAGASWDAIVAIAH
ncbi:MAG: hypothetical protein ACT4QG_05570 [Sporichthyaceae bacterium]